MHKASRGGLDSSRDLFLVEMHRDDSRSSEGIGSGRNGLKGPYWASRRNTNAKAQGAPCFCSNCKLHGPTFLCSYTQHPQRS